MSIAPLRKKYLGEILLEKNLINKEQLKEALDEQRTTKEKLGAILLKRNLISDENLLKALAESFRIPLMRLHDLKVDEMLLKILSEKTARKHLVMPISKTDSSIKIAMADPLNMAAIDDIETETKLKVSIVLASDKDVRESIERCYSGGGLSESQDAHDAALTQINEADDVSGNDAEAADAAPVVKYVNALLYEAVSKGASDIHIEPGEFGVTLRMRLDGSLKESQPPPQKFYNAIISRIKIIASLDIAERRLPQDGKCKLKLNDRKIDVRVSTLPTLYGEKVVLRVLDRTSVSLTLDGLGYNKTDGDNFREVLEKPYGMILVTGPTGSGKTTTLYTGLSYINTPDRNIITVEDPVEIELKGINQVHVRANIGLTFASVLRSILRQDPDVIMVGEIRDKETAEISIQAALTGHLVLSTLHTNDAVSSLSRLSYMGIEPILISDAVDLVIAQRLMRRICPKCRVEATDIPENLLERLGLNRQAVKIFRGAGCENCFGTGYKGRTAITEVLRLSNNIKKMVIKGESDIAIREVAEKEGMRSLRQCAVDKLKEGVTTIEEVLSVTTAAF
jgi:type IV pilus assembly protein PilB